MKHFHFKLTVLIPDNEEELDRLFPDRTPGKGTASMALENLSQVTPETTLAHLKHEFRDRPYEIERLP